MPQIFGTLRSASADRLVDDRTGDAYFLAKIEVDPDELARLKDVRLAPGMSAEVMIYTGERTGYLPQDVELFDGTVFANIARFDDAETAEVIAAAQLAGCHEMILRLPNGYETEIGDGGALLSGGQRQLVGLARALFRNPRLVVLDEPNANMDTEGEMALMHALENLKTRQATVIMITHRPSLVQSVDKVLVMRDGIAESFGPRDEVMKRLIKPVADRHRRPPIRWLR